MYFEPTFGSPLFPPSYALSFGIGFVVFFLITFRLRRKVRDSLIFSLIFLGVIISLGAYVLLPAPAVSKVTPANGSDNFNPKDQVIVEFDRPVSRRSMEKTISPDIPGVWVFEDPIYATHLYRKVVFHTQDGLKPDTTYSVKIANIQNTIRKSKPYEFEFSFKTQKVEGELKVSKPEEKIFKLSVPVYIQQHTLSCEISSLRMTLAYKGINKTEEELLDQIGVDNTPHIGNVWGNPYERFVGNVNGSQMKDGYGVYWPPIERVAKTYGDAKAFEGGDVKMLTKEIQAGNPVIIWVYSKSGKPTYWKTPSGTEIYAVAGEHTVVAVGFVGPADNPTQIIVNDSLVGQVYWPRSLFDQKWATFNEAGVIVYK